MTAPGLERYDLARTMEHLEIAIDATKKGDTQIALYNLCRAVAQVMDHIRAKERGDI